MSDVFGGLAGGPGDEGSGGVCPERLDAVLDGAALLGVQLDPKFRVLAATFELTVDAYVWGAVDDRRIQVLCYPVSTLLAALRRRGEGAGELLAFDEEHLVDVVAAMDGAAVTAPLFDQPEPRPGEWGPRFSLEGRSTAPDGVRHTLRASIRHDDLELDVFARFDEVALRDAAGGDLELPA